MRDYYVRLLCKATMQDLESAMWLLVSSPAGVTQDCSGQEASDFLGRSYLRTYRPEKGRRQLIVSQFEDGNPVGMP